MNCSRKTTRIQELFLQFDFRQIQKALPPKRDTPLVQPNGTPKKDRVPHVPCFSACVANHPVRSSRRLWWNSKRNVNMPLEPGRRPVSIEVYSCICTGAWELGQAFCTEKSRWLRVCRTHLEKAEWGLNDFGRYLHSESTKLTSTNQPT